MPNTLTLPDTDQKGAQLQAKGRIAIGEIKAALVKANPWMGQV